MRLTMGSRVLRVDMRLHESHEEGGFGVPNNTISRHAAAYTTNWSVPSLRTLKHLHETLLQDYHCTEQPVANQPAQPSGAGGSAAANAGAPPPR